MSYNKHQYMMLNSLTCILGYIMREYNGKCLIMTPPDGYLGILTHASRMVSYHGALVSNG